MDFTSVNQLDLTKLQQDYWHFLANENPQLHKTLLQPENNMGIYNSAVTLQTAPYLSAFLAQLFAITDQAATLQQQCRDGFVIQQCKIQFMRRVVYYRYRDSNVLPSYDMNMCCALLKCHDINELSQQQFCSLVLELINDSTAPSSDQKNNMDELVKYCAIQIHNDDPDKWEVFKLPRPNSINKIHDLDNNNNDSTIIKRNAHFYQEDFTLNDHANAEHALAHARYCLLCHERDKDTCRHGIDNSVNNDSDSTKAGCPLDQKISEMIQLYQTGDAIAALAVIMIDNPLLILTGHRICNDCSQACIYQQQTSVDIPAIESMILSQILDLDYGFELYYLLTLWNPLITDVPVVNDPSNILIVGTGPAGIALSYYMLRQGHNVIAIDGLYIDTHDHNHSDRLIKNVKQEIFTDLATMQLDGFGGICSYGITNRWNKNYLRLAKILLTRHNRFSIFGGITWGQTLNYNAAKDLGFQHIALCTGAGAPKVPDNITNVLTDNRQHLATSFLFDMHLRGLYLEHNHYRNFFKLPIVIIGSGLTAIDTAMQAKTYYLQQIKRLYQQYGDDYNGDNVQLREFLSHHQQLTQMDNPVAKNNKFMELGGVIILSRKPFIKSSGYIVNPEEIDYCLMEGIKIIDNHAPEHIIADDDYATIVCANDKTIKAGSIVYATGQDLHTRLCQYNDMSVWGDMHDEYKGSVVKAIASVKNRYQQLSASLGNDNKVSITQKTNIDIHNTCREMFDCVITNVIKYDNGLTKLQVRNKIIAQNFQPGQFVRIHLGSAKDYQILSVLEITGDIITLVTSLPIDSIDNKFCIMGPAGQPIVANTQADVVIFVGQYHGNYALPALTHQFAQHNYHALEYITDSTWRNHEVISSQLQQMPTAQFYNDDIAQCLAQRLQHYSQHNMRIEIISMTGLPLLQQSRELESRYRQHVISHQYLVSAPMHCAMAGVCGQCLIKLNSNDNDCANKARYVFGCKHQVVNAQELDIEFLNQRYQQNKFYKDLMKG